MRSGAAFSELKYYEASNKVCERDGLVNARILSGQ